MATESFRYIEYNKEENFINKDGRISLAEYTKDLSFYAPFSINENAEYFEGINAPIKNGTTIEDFSDFGLTKSVRITEGNITYDRSNFENVASKGTVQFRLKPNFSNGKGYQDFLATEISGLEGDYGFSLDVYYGENNSTTKDVVITIENSDDLEIVFGKMALAVNIALGTLVMVQLNNNAIRISSINKGDIVQISPPINPAVLDLIETLGGVSESMYPNAPEEDTKLIDLYNGVDNKNRITLTHTDESHLLLEMYDENGKKKVNKDMGIWNNKKYHWYAFELNWNKAMAGLFINGTMIDITKTGFNRGSNTNLILSANSNSYSFGELIVYNSQVNKDDYTPSISPLTKYSSSQPYVDVHFGSGFRTNEVVGFNLDCSSNIHFVVGMDNKWYYYYAGEWRNSDGSFNQSSEPAVIETKFSELLFEEDKEIIIRAYFDSDGATLAWLDEMSIVTEFGEAQAATIIGTVSITTVDLSEDSHVVITTSKGKREVDLAEFAVNRYEVTLDEIKQAINNAKVPGLASASDDGRGRLVLRTKETGKDTFVSISEGEDSNALPLVWGHETIDVGSQATGQFFDYSEIYRWIRSQLGAPTVPVELTDEQLQDCVTQAVYWYNYYRNAKENIIYVTLEGDVRSGWKIPQEVGGEDNIIEIIMHPRFPYTFYTGRTDIIGQVYMQWFFQQHQRDLRHMAGDYYLTMSTQKDLNNIMGTEIKWHFYNGRLFIHPEPPVGAKIGVRFRSAVSLNEINTNIFIRDYALGKAKTILGTIRSTFGGTIPGGSEMITLRGEAMIAEGKEEMEAVITRMQQLTEPLGFEWG